MRLAAEIRTCLLRICLLRAVVCLLIGIGLASACPELSAATTDAKQPTEGEVQRALIAVKADPNLATEVKRRVPTFWNSEPREPGRSLSLSWLSDLFKWLAATSRVLLWVLVTIFGALLVMMLVRLLRSPARLRAAAAAAATPTHIRDLDIRPESLPAQIGAAARQLWEQHESRAALALLYRGLLSRLVHVHALPIRESTTEASCIELARVHARADLLAYVVRLVRSWQRAVYGGMHPSDEEFHALCADFDAILGVSGIGKVAA